MFVHAGTAEEGGSAVFTDVQELVGMGGLDTHATEKSLRTAAARAGVEDVDRWVVAAVLWQATDAVAKTDCPQSPRQGSMETEAATAAVGLEGGTPDMTAATTPKVVLTQATPLWEELRNEAFRSVLGRSSSWRYEERTVPSADVQPSSATGSTPSTPRGQAQRAGVPVLAGETSANEGCIAQHPRQRYAALQSTWGSFDRALVGALVFVGRGNMVPKLSTTTLGGGQTGNVNSDVAGSLKSVEGILLHTFVIAGFADGSGLGVSDIVDAVSTRRKRVLSAAAAAAATTAGSPSCGIIEEGNGALVGSNKNTCRPGGPRGLEGLPESGRRCVNDLSTRETGTADIELRPVRVDGEQETLANDNGAVDGVSMETDMESRLLVGIPVELRELFRTAALAQAIRRKPQQQHQEASNGNVHGFSHHDSRLKCHHVGVQHGHLSLNITLVWVVDVFSRNKYETELVATCISRTGEPGKHREQRGGSRGTGSFARSGRQSHPRNSAIFGWENGAAPCRRTGRPFLGARTARKGM